MNTVCVRTRMPLHCIRLASTSTTEHNTQQFLCFLLNPSVLYTSKWPKLWQYVRKWNCEVFLWLFTVPWSQVCIIIHSIKQAQVCLPAFWDSIMVPPPKIKMCKVSSWTPWSLIFCCKMLVTNEATLCKHSDGKDLTSIMAKAWNLTCAQKPELPLS
jgi:hypothetical protein